MMTPQELIQYGEKIHSRHLATMEIVSEREVAAADIISTDHRSDSLAEPIFLRAFTAYENDVERLFLHYVTGGLSLQGAGANSYLSIRDEIHARRLTKAGFKFLSWAKPTEIRTTAQTYIENGWPIVDMMVANAQSSSDCERLRNRIAHNSTEASQQFNVVQRNMLSTERLFDLTPGQFLRIRSTRLRKMHIEYYLSIMTGTLDLLIDPTA